MKLIFCPSCRDVLALRMHFRSCECGKSGGRYVDNLNAIIKGDAIPIGFHNMSFGTAVGLQPLQGWGRNFVAFVIPKICPTVSRDVHPVNANDIESL